MPSKRKAKHFGIGRSLLRISGTIPPVSKYIAKLFGKSLTTAELLDPNLELKTLLFRLFNELGVYIQPPRQIIDRCRCNDDKVKTMLHSFSKEQLKNLADENSNLVVDCEFCKRRRIFSSNLKAH